MELTSQRGAPGRPPGPARREVVVLLPGQGSQHGRMATGLYGHDPEFTAGVEEVFGALGRDGARLRADWLDSDPADPINEITRSQPMLLAVGYALGRMLLSRGVRPAALLGHSIGEIAGATVAGVFTPEDAARMVWGRVTGLARAPRGGMLAVAAAEPELLPFLHGTGVAVAAINAPGQTVLSGMAGPLGAVRDTLRRHRYRCRPVPSHTALHSPALAPFAGDQGQVFAGIGIRPPGLRVHSCYTTETLTAELAVSPAFWMHQPLITVRFWPALQSLLSEGDFVLVEAGPGRVLTGIARRHPAVRSGRCTLAPLLPAQHQGAAADRRAVRGVLDLLQAGALPPDGGLRPRSGGTAGQPDRAPALAGPAGRRG